ncbi:MAG TPA: class I SAM-dependent methyltransferase [Candidatus Dormibacteraeota bacterium]|nr:class I SAM-dependent methyltransferase [Candidatus Dormibacteraeota bacterium]
MSHRHGDVERFGRWAPNYDHSYLQRLVFEPVHKTVLELAAREVPRPGAILDVGCGTGRLLDAAAEQFPGARLEGVDAADGMIEQAKAAAGGRANFQLATAERLPFADGQFDLVFSTMTFHHWADQRRGIAEIGRVLTPSGRWILADLVVSGWLRYVRRVFRMRQFPERDQLDAMLASAQLGVLADRRVQQRISVLAIGTGAPTIATA